VTKENGHAEKRDVLTLEQAAKLLQMHEHTVVRLAQEGAIPGRKLGRQWRFSRQALLESLEPETELGTEEQHEGDASARSR
jgi:excisionase family DNA binding protein